MFHLLISFFSCAWPDGLSRSRFGQVYVVSMSGEVWRVIEELFRIYIVETDNPAIIDVYSHIV